MTFESSAGLSVRNHYGARKIKDFGGHVSTEGNTKQIRLHIDLAEEITGAPATSNVLTEVFNGQMEAQLPAYAQVLSARITTASAIATLGGSAAASVALSLGLNKVSDGTAIDIDGLLQAADGVCTIASNDWVEASGVAWQGAAALNGNRAATTTPLPSIGADAGELYCLLAIDDISDMTSISGKLVVEVEYIDPRVDATGNYTAGGVLGG